MKYSSAKKIFFVVFLLLFVLLYGCSKKETSEDIGNKSKKEAKKVENEIKDIKRQTQFFCELTGEEVYKNDKHQLIAVMINNEPGAIPQSSLDEADYLYEALIEGGATRIMAIYHHTYPNKIGPIRSARPYFMQIAKSIGAYYVHCGGSPQAYRLFKQNYINHIDAIYTGSDIFYRTRDRKAPHNLYSSMEKLIKYFEKKGNKIQQDIKSYPLSDKVVNKIASKNNKAILRFSGWYYVKYIYDKQKKSYLRYEKERPHLDKEKNIQLEAKNLVIIIVRYNTIKNDDSGRQEVYMTSGKGYLLQEGQTIPISYTFSEKDSFVLKDLDNKNISLLKGKTWFELVPQYGKIDIE